MGTFNHFLVIISYVAILCTVTSFQPSYRRHHITRKFSDINGDLKIEGVLMTDWLIDKDYTSDNATYSNDIQFILST
jgi:hypothetical protein